MRRIHTYRPTQTTKKLIQWNFTKTDIFCRVFHKMGGATRTNSYWCIEARSVQSLSILCAGFAIYFFFGFCDHDRDHGHYCSMFVYQVSAKYKYRDHIRSYHIRLVSYRHRLQWTKIRVGWSNWYSVHTDCDWLMHAPTPFPNWSLSPSLPPSLSLQYPIKLSPYPHIQITDTICYQYSTRTTKIS